MTRVRDSYSDNINDARIKTAAAYRRLADAALSAAEALADESTPDVESHHRDVIRERLSAISESLLVLNARRMGAGWAFSAEDVA